MLPWRTTDEAFPKGSPQPMLPRPCLTLQARPEALTEACRCNSRSCRSVDVECRLVKLQLEGAVSMGILNKDEAASEW